MSDSNDHGHDRDAEPPTLTILYATETGTAQDAAAQIARRVKHAGFPVRVHDVAATRAALAVVRHIRDAA